LNDAGAFQVTKRRTAASLAFSLIIMAAPGNARAPLSDETARGDRATLVVRSQRWMEIRVNGRDLGFAPLEIRGLKPGTHRIQWKSSETTGEMRLTLSSGQRRSISERDLVLPPPSR
jgi:hypothetical protein